MASSADYVRTIDLHPLLNWGITGSNVPNMLIVKAGHLRRLWELRNNAPTPFLVDPTRVETLREPSQNVAAQLSPQRVVLLHTVSLREAIIVCGSLETTRWLLGLL